MFHNTPSLVNNEVQGVHCCGYEILILITFTKELYTYMNAE